jgi:hypothetical protein
VFEIKLKDLQGLNLFVDDIKSISIYVLDDDLIAVVLNRSSKAHLSAGLISFVDTIIHVISEGCVKTYVFWKDTDYSFGSMTAYLVFAV